MPRRKALEKTGIDGLDRRPESVAEGKRDRSWDEAHRAFPVRIREVDAERLSELAEGLSVSRDAVTRALVELALDAVDADRVDFETRERTRETKDRLGRLRITTRRFVLASWAAERNGKGDE